MTGYLDQAVLENLPQGLQKKDFSAPCTFEDAQIIRFRLPQSRGTQLPRLLHSIADLQQGHVFSRFVARRPLPPYLQDLKALREEEQDTEAPITTHAYETAQKTLSYLDALAGSLLQAPHLSPDGSGGIRMEWFRGNTNVRAVIPPREEQRPYMYFILNGDSRVEKLSNALLFVTLRLHVMRG